MPKDERLSDMLDNLINNKPEQAQVDFHDYLQDKMQTAIQGEEEPVPVQSNEETTDEE